MQAFRYVLCGGGCMCVSLPYWLSRKCVWRAERAQLYCRRGAAAVLVFQPRAFLYGCASLSLSANVKCKFPRPGLPEETPYNVPLSLSAFLHILFFYFYFFNVKKDPFFRSFAFFEITGETRIPPSPVFTLCIYVFFF